MDEILKQVYQQQKTLADNQEGTNDRLTTVGSQIAASNRATTRIADAVNASEQRQQADDRALTILIKVIDEFKRQRDPERMSAEELADVMSLDKASAIRQVLWQRKNAHRGPQQALPLPPIPNDLVAVPPPPPRNDEPTGQQPKHNRRKGDSISTRVDGKGRRRWRLDVSNESLKEAFKWLVASGIGAAMLKALQHALSGG